MNYAIRPATSTDIPAIADVARETWRATYAHSVAPHNQLQLLERSYAPAALAAAIAAETSWFYVAENDAHIVGFAQFLRRADGYGELARIYVLPGHQRQGVGRAFLAAGAAAMERAGVPICYVSVEVDNGAAIAFYLRHGFRRNRAHATFLGDQIVRLIELKASTQAIGQAAQEAEGKQ